MRRYLKEDILIVLFLLFLTLFVFRKAVFGNLVPIPVNFMAFWYEPFKSQAWPDYPLGVPHKPVGADVFRNLYPLKNLAVDSLVSGKWPFWNPYIFSGTPLLANFQTSVFYPLNLLYFFLPFVEAWTIIIIIQPFLAGIFMYLFLRAMKVSRLGAFFSASAFALLPFLIVWFEHSVFVHTLIWLPLVLFAVEKFLERISWWSFFLITLGLVLAIFGGHPQPLFFVFLVVISYFLFRLTQPVKLKKKKLFLFFSAVLFSFLLTAVQLFPTFELFRLSAIGAQSSEFIFKKFLLSPLHLITFFIPDFFGNVATYNFWGFFDYTETIGYFGILPLIFGLYAIFWRREKRVLFFFLLAMVSLSLAFSLPTTRFFISLNLPVISTNVPSRIFFITGFCFLVLAGFGIDEWRKKIDSKASLKKVLRIGISLSFIYLGAVVFSFLMFKFSSGPRVCKSCWWTALRNSLFAGMVFLAAATLLLLGSFRKKRGIFISALIVLNCFSGLYFANKFLAFSDRKLVFPQTPVIKFLQENAGINRFFGFSQANIIPNIAAYYRLFSPNGYDPLYIKRYGQLLEAANTDGRIKEVVTRSDAYLDPGSETDLLKDNPRRKRALDLLGVKYILAKSDSSGFPPEDYPPVGQEGDWQVYENKEALPRAFLAYDYEVAEKDQEIIDLIFDENIDLAKRVILEEEPELTIQPCGQVAMEEVEITQYTPNKIAMKVNSFCSGLLFISDVFYPGWTAYLDGKEEKVYRANFVFRAVAIPEGKHQVLFSYEPESFYLGLRVTILAAVLFIICLGLLKFCPFWCLWFHRMSKQRGEDIGKESVK